MLEIALLAGAVLVLAAVATPVHLVLALERQEAVSGTLGLRWTVLKWKTPLGARKERKPKPDKRRSRGGPFPLRTIRAIARVPGTPAVLGAFLQRMIRSVRIGGISARLRVGAEDPADTGHLWGWIGPWFLLARQPGWLDLGVEPDFANAGLRGTAEGRLCIYPARLIYAVVRTLLSPTSIHLAVAVVRTRPWKR